MEKKPSDSRISIKKRENWKRILMVGKPHHATVATVASYKNKKWMNVRLTYFSYEIHKHNLLNKRHL